MPKYTSPSKNGSPSKPLSPSKNGGPSKPLGPSKHSPSKVADMSRRNTPVTPGGSDAPIQSGYISGITLSTPSATRSVQGHKDSNVTGNDEEKY